MLIPPPISVVIPTYNGARFIQRALASVLRQTRPPAEIIVVDDASTDDTVAQTRGVARHSAVPIRIIEQHRNSGGPSGPMNVGVAACRTPLVATLDQDDEMLETRLDVQSAALESCAASPATIGLLAKVCDDGSRIAPEFEEASRARILGITHEQVGPYFVLEPDAFYRHVLAEGTLTIASSTAFRVSAWQSMGGFAQALRVAWDLDFSCRLAGVGPVVFTNETVGSYRLHDANTSAQGLTGYREVIRVKQQQFARPLFPVDHGWLERDIRDRLLGLAYHESVRGHVRETLSACGEARNYGAPMTVTIDHMVKGMLRAARTSFGPANGSVSRLHFRKP